MFVFVTISHMKLLYVYTSILIFFVCVKFLDFQCLLTHIFLVMSTYFCFDLYIVMPSTFFCICALILLYEVYPGIITHIFLYPLIGLFIIFALCAYTRINIYMLKHCRIPALEELQKLRAKLPDLEAKEQKSREALASAEAAVEDERRSANATAVQDIPPVSAPSPTLPATLEPAGEEQENTAEKPVVSEYSKWMDGAEKVLEEKPVVSEYSKWMDGAEQVLKADAEGAEGAEVDFEGWMPAAKEVEENGDDNEEDGLSGLQRIKAKLREVWTALKGAVFGNKTPAEKALERAKELHNEAKKQLKHDKVRIEELVSWSCKCCQCFLCSRNLPT